MSPTPTGRRETRGFGEAVVLERSFAASADVVWEAVTDPERMRRWIGTWTGDPSTGQVAFRMTAEGEDAPEETVTIDACEPPRLLRARSRTGDEEQVWHWELTLAEAAGTTRLTFAQSTAGDVPVSDVGPGWEYYLDRLAAHLADRDVGSVDWDRDYYPAMSGYYRDLFA